MRNDFKTAIRSLLGSKTFTAMVLIVLALGIGAATAIFSVVDAVVLRGATRETITRMVLASAARIVVVGLAIGTLGAWSLRAAAERFLFRLQGDDPRGFLVAVGVLSAVALLASLVPARRAARVDPLDALRAE